MCIWNDVIDLAKKECNDSDYCLKSRTHPVDDQPRQPKLSRLSLSVQVKECGGAREVKLSRRESQCVYLSMQGHTLMQMSKMLTISARTVEDYFAKAKRKFGCRKRQELFQKVANSDFFEKFEERGVCLKKDCSD